MHRRSMVRRPEPVGDRNRGSERQSDPEAHAAGARLPVHRLCRQGGLRVGQGARLAFGQGLRPAQKRTPLADGEVREDRTRRRFHGSLLGSWQRYVSSPGRAWPNQPAVLLGQDPGQAAPHGQPAPRLIAGPQTRSRPPSHGGVDAPATYPVASVSHRMPGPSPSSEWSSQTERDESSIEHLAARIDTLEATLTSLRALLIRAYENTPRAAVDVLRVRRGPSYRNAYLAQPTGDGAYWRLRGG